MKLLIVMSLSMSVIYSCGDVYGSSELFLFVNRIM